MTPQTIRPMGFVCLAKSKPKPAMQIALATICHFRSIRSAIRIASSGPRRGSQRNQERVVQTLRDRYARAMISVGTQDANPNSRSLKKWNTISMSVRLR